MRKILFPAAIAAAFMSMPLAATAAGDGPIVIAIKNHRFEPAELRAPAGKQVELVVENHDKTPEEFDSRDLRREKVIPGGRKATLRIDPLKKGVYRFMGEFHAATAKGKIIVE